MSIEMDWSTNHRDSIGKKQGLWRYYYDDGSIACEETYFDNVLNGMYKTWGVEGSGVITIRIYINATIEGEGIFLYEY